MSNESAAITAGAGKSAAGEFTAAGASAAAPSAPAAPEVPEPASGAWLAVPALAWLAMMLWSALASLDSPGGGALDVIHTAIGLPAVIAAALVAGAGVGLALLRLGGARLVGRSAAGFVIALGGGLLTGTAAAATVVLSQDVGGSAVMALAAVIAAAATVGGALAGTRATMVVAAGVAASLAVFLFTGVRAYFDSELLALFGAGQDPVSVLTAQRWLSRAAALVAGLIAGLVAFAVLRRAARLGTATPRWPSYLLAGAGAGAGLLVTEVIVRSGGAPLLALARSVSAGDQLFQELAAAARTNSALIVLFVGALTAMIAFGRTLDSATERAGTAGIADPVDGSGRATGASGTAPVADQEAEPGPGS